MRFNKGLSLIELMITIAEVSILATVGRKNDFVAMLSGTPPNDSFREVARLYAPTLCGEMPATGVPVQTCVKFGNVKCTDVAQKVVFDCIVQHKANVPPTLTQQEQRLLMQVAAPCIQQSWGKTIFQRFEIDVQNPACQVPARPAYRRRH